MAVDCADAEFAHSPWFVSEFLNEFRALGLVFGAQGGGVGDVHIAVPRMEFDLPRGNGVLAFTEHYSEAAPGEECPARYGEVNAQSKDGRVVLGGFGQIENCQRESGRDEVGHSRILAARCRACQQQLALLLVLRQRCRAFEFEASLGQAL